LLAVRQTGSGNLPAPVDLRTRTLSATSVRLHWVDPSLDRTQVIRDERYYNVYYHAAAPNARNLSVIVKALHVTLHELEPRRRYGFKVRTVKGAHTSPFSETVTHRTLTDNGTIRDILFVLFFSRPGDFYIIEFTVFFFTLDSTLHVRLSYVY